MEKSTVRAGNLDLSSCSIPSYIAIEGPIGIGKTTLAKRLAHSFNYETLLEKAEENPFLERFYQDPRSNALPTQLYFLFQRMRKLQDLRQGDIFQPVRISDFLIDRTHYLPRSRWTMMNIVCTKLSMTMLSAI